MKIIPHLKWSQATLKVKLSHIYHSAAYMTNRKKDDKDYSRLFISIGSIFAYSDSRQPPDQKYLK